MELTKSQLKVVNHSYDPKTVLSVQAGPGTGKTLTLIHRVKKLLEDGMDPNEIVVLSMTNRTVKSFRQALAGLIGEEAEQIRIQTFHSFANSLIENYSGDYFPDKGAQILVNDTSFRGYTNLFMDIKSKRPRAFEKAILAVKSGEDIDEMSKKFKVDKNDLEDTIRRFHENGILTYHDFISSAIELIDVSQGEIVKDVLVFIVDEFQDMQPELVKFIEKLIEFDGKHITLAGDRNQCIYGFLGSYPEITRNFIKRLKWKYDEIFLKESFRLTPENMVIANSLMSEDTHLISMKESSAEPLIVDIESPQTEYNFIAREIYRLILQLGGLLKFSDFIVLARSNKEVETIANFVTSEYGYNVNRFTLGNDWINSKVHIFLDILDVLRKSKGSDMAFLFILQNLGILKIFLRKLYEKYEVWDSHKQIRFEDFLKLPKVKDLFNTDRRLKSKSIIDNFIGIIAEERQIFTNPVEVMISLSRIINETSLINYLNKTDDTKDKESSFGLADNLEGFHRSLKASYLKNPSLEYFLRNYQDEEPRLDDNAINISTIHKAKGLEFPVVFLTKSRLQFAKTEEEKRLLYVAMTRAKNLLYCNLSKQERGVPVVVNPSWIYNTARDLNRPCPTMRHLVHGQRIFKTILSVI